jgi:hypothetical protein
MNTPPEDDIPDIPEEEMEMELEQTHGRPLAGNPAERIAVLTKRIKYLEDLLKSALLEEPSLHEQAMINGINIDLTEARRQLKEWQSKHDGRN